MKQLVPLSGLAVLLIVLSQISVSQEFDFSEGAKLDDSLGNTPQLPSANPESKVFFKDGKLMVTNARVAIFKRNQLTIAAERPGTLSMVNPNQAGQMVQAKDIVARLKDDEPKAAFDVAEKRAANDIEIRYARSVNDVNQVKFDKANAANRKRRNAFTSLEIRELKLEVDRSTLQIEKAGEDQVIAGLERDQAKAALSAYSIAAEIGGEVTEIMKTTGEAVTQGDPIMVITDLSKVKCVGQVPLKYSHLARKGARVEVRIVVDNADLEMENMVFPGKIIFVAPSVEEFYNLKEFHAEIVNQAINDEFVLRGEMKVQVTILPQ